MATSKALLKTTALLKLIVAVIVTGLVASLLFVPYIAGAGLASNSGLDKFLDAKCNLKPARLDQSTSIYARDGKTLITTLFKDDRRIVPLSAVPLIAQRALIDTEDRRFYSHHGLDVRGLARAAVNDSGSNATQGASTLTQQLVKQIRFYDAGSSKAKQAAAIADTTDRKIYEAKCALKLEQEYSKKSILGQYFNIAYFGEQSYGIAVAAKNYFGVSQSKLTVPQAALLAGLVRSPTDYDPFQHRAAAIERRNEVIANMVTAGDITAKAARRYEKSALVLNQNTRTDVGAQGCTYAKDALIKNVGFFCDYALNWLETTGGMSKDQVETGGYKIITSIDPKLQNTATAKEWKKFPASSPTALVQPSIDPTTGEITSFITNKHYKYGGLQVAATDNRYTQNPLFTADAGGSGSTFKLFTMIAALTAGVQPSQLLTTPGSKYFPKNCGEQATKPVNGITKDGPSTTTLKNAFAISSNIYFVGMEDQIFNCNLSTIVKTAQDLGVTSLNKPDPRAPGMTVAQAVVAGPRYTFTLGQESISPLELSRAYGVPANDGVLCDSRPILKITSANGKNVPFKYPTCHRVMSQWVARTAIQIMQGPTTFGTAANQFSSFYNDHSRFDYPIAGKTGTNNASFQTGPNRGKDSKLNAALWFVGVTPKLVAATAMFNPVNPTKPIAGVPGFSDESAAHDAFGAESAVFFLKSFGSTIDKKSWSWPSPFSVTNGEQVPSVREETTDSAVQRLKEHGFKPVEYPIQCGSNVIPDLVAYSGPDYAAPGSTVYYCVSDGKPLNSPPAVKRPTQSKKPAKTTKPTKPTKPTGPTKPTPPPTTPPTQPAPTKKPAPPVIPPVHTKPPRHH